MLWFLQNSSTRDLLQAYPGRKQSCANVEEKTLLLNARIQHLCGGRWAWPKTLQEQFNEIYWVSSVDRAVCIWWFHFSLTGQKVLITLSPQVPAKTDCVMCFGPVVPDGYGVCYNPMEEHINFAISAFNSCADTNAARMAHYLEKALLDMRILLQAAPKSKL